MPKSSLLTVEQAAEYFNTTERYVRRVLRYEIPVVRLGNRLYFHQTDLDRFIAEKTEVPAK